MTTETKAPAYVIAPEGCADYLTPGKRYAVRNWSGGVFNMTDDRGREINCFFPKSAHVLNGGDWIIPDEADATPFKSADEPLHAEDVMSVYDRRFVAAVAAMQGMLTSGNWDADSADYIAGFAVKHADALLAALGGE